jgi:hypothetical protein
VPVWPLDLLQKAGAMILPRPREWKTDGSYTYYIEAWKLGLDAQEYVVYAYRGKRDGHVELITATLTPDEWRALGGLEAPHA